MSSCILKSKDICVFSQIRDSAEIHYFFNMDYMDLARSLSESFNTPSPSTHIQTRQTIVVAMTVAEVVFVYPIFPQVKLWYAIVTIYLTQALQRIFVSLNWVIIG